MSTPAAKLWPTTPAAREPRRPAKRRVIETTGIELLDAPLSERGAPEPANHQAHDYAQVDGPARVVPFANTLRRVD